MKLIHGDCREYLFTCEPDSIDLTVTSPPYDNLRTYNNSSTWGWAEFAAIAAGLWRVTKPGGVVVWVAGDATIKGSETGSSFKQALFFKDCGFNLYDTMIYNTNKPPMNDNRYQACFEYMFVLSKGKPATFSKIMIPCKHAGKKNTSRVYFNTDGTKKAMSKPGVYNDLKVKESIWFFSSGNDKSGHPAAFPKKLAHDHIISWSNEGDTIFDPFMGSGTTGKMAKQLNRDFIGIEIDKEYFEIAKQRIEGTQYNQQINRTQKAAPVI